VTVLPDILTNAGGGCVSYLEWVQGLSYVFGMSSVNREMEALMVQAYHQVTQSRRRGRFLEGGVHTLGVGQILEHSLTEASTHNWSKIVFKKADSYRLR